MNKAKHRIRFLAVIAVTVGVGSAMLFISWRQSTVNPQSVEFEWLPIGKWGFGSTAEGISSTSMYTWSFVPTKVAHKFGVCQVTRGCTESNPCKDEEEHVFSRMDAVGR